MGGVVVADAPSHLVVASEQGVYELARGGASGATLMPSKTDALAVGRIDGARIVVAHVADAVRIVAAEGAETEEPRDVPLLPGRADVRALVVDGAGRIYALRETVVDTLEPGASTFTRNVLVGRSHAWSATAAADGDGIFVLGEEGERGVVIRVTKNGQQTFATTDKRIWRAWASKTALWGIDSTNRLYRIDLVSRAVRVESPEVGSQTAIAGVETANGDLVVVVGEVSAVYDGKRFTYPTGNTSDSSSVAVDPESAAAYVTLPGGLRRIDLGHRWLAARSAPFEAPVAGGTERGPVREPVRPEERATTLPSLRLGYGYGWHGDHDASEFDAAAGLRLGMRLSDHPHFFVWPEAGYTSSVRGRYAMLGAGVHWGTYLASTGPSVRGLLGAEDGGSQAAGIRSSWHAIFVAGLLNVELGHQLMFVPGGPRHEGRALISADLLVGGGLLLYLGVPLGLLSGFLVTEALR